MQKYLWHIYILIHTKYFSHNIIFFLLRISIKNHIIKLFYWAISHKKIFYLNKYIYQCLIFTYNSFLENVNKSTQAHIYTVRVYFCNLFIYQNKWESTWWTKYYSNWLHSKTLLLNFSSTFVFITTWLELCCAVLWFNYCCCCLVIHFFRYFVDK